MKKMFAILFCMAMLLSAAHAQTASQSADALTQSCMGGEDPQKDPERAQYCACMRESMANWTDEDFKQVAAEAAKAHSAGQEPTKLQELAKACITKVLGPEPQ